MKLKKFQIVFLLLLFIFSAGAVQASSIKTNDSIYIAPQQVVSGNLFAAGKTITVDGNISGDLIAIAQNININGQVNGDVIALVSQNININGTVGGNVRVASNSININGQIVRNLNAIGTNIVIGNKAKIGWDALMAGSSAEIRGNINGSLEGHLSRVLITGNVGDINLILPKNRTGQTLTISPSAIIRGNLIYSSNQKASISSNAQISGKIEKKAPPGEENGWLIPWLWKELLAIFSALIAGLILVFILKTPTTNILKEIKEKPAKTILPGLAVMFILPPIALILALTIIGIPLAVVTMATWFILLYFSKILLAILIGELLINKINKKKPTSFFWPLVLGVPICWLLFSIPLVGWVLSLIAIWFGLGGIWLYASYQFKNI